MNSPRIYALHDQAITIELGNEINEAINLEVLYLKQDFEATPFQGFIECVPAYSSLTIYFDDNRTLEEIRKEIKSRLEKKNSSTDKSTLIETTLGSTINIKPIIIPVCYDVEYGTDLNWLSNHLGLSIDEIISIVHLRPGFSFNRCGPLGFTCRNAC
jgi:inhibitor of KinA